MLGVRYGPLSKAGKFNHTKRVGKRLGCWANRGAHQMRYTVFLYAA